MTVYLRNSLTYVWAFLAAITVFSWWISHEGGTAFRVNQAVTIGVLVIAAVKVQCVMQHFMEVQTAPTWLRRTCVGWLLAIFALLLGCYYAAL